MTWADDSVFVMNLARIGVSQTKVEDSAGQPPTRPEFEWLT